MEINLSLFDNKKKLLPQKNHANVDDLMAYNALGNTNLRVSKIGFGCIPIMRLNMTAAKSLLKYGFDMGINFYDTANGYGDSEEKLGETFCGMRNKIIIGTKSLERDGKNIMEHINLSLKRLKTDYIDLYQLHQVSQMEDYNKIFAQGGALETLHRAKKKGK